MDIKNFKETTHTNYRHILERYVGYKWDKTIQRKVEAFFDAFAKLYKETQGGVYLEDFGYFCHIKSPKRIFNRNDILYRPYFPYLFTELANAHGSKVRYWNMEGAFKEEFEPDRPHTLHYTTLKKYAEK